jgi:NitT/TauT family transport system permease protein
MNDRARPWLAPVLGGALIMGCWYALRHGFGAPAWALPMPHEVLRAIHDDWPTFSRAGLLTARSALLGFFAAALGGLGFAMVLASGHWARRALYPYLLVLQLTPVIVVAPLIILWADRGLHSIVLVTFIVSFFPVVVNTTLGLVSTDRNLVELFDVCDARWWQRLLLLRLPYAMPHYFAGLRIAASLAPIGAIFGEYVTGSMEGGVGGLGFLAYFFSNQQKPAMLLAVGAVSCALGFVFLGVISAANWLLLRRWHDSVERNDG